MARRSEDWNIGLAKDLRDAAFAREFLLAAVDEGGDLQLALRKVIRAMGVKPAEAVPATPQSGAAHQQGTSSRRVTRADGLWRPALIVTSP